MLVLGENLGRTTANAKVDKHRIRRRQELLVLSDTSDRQLIS